MLLAKIFTFFARASDLILVNASCRRLNSAATAASLRAQFAMDVVLGVPTFRNSSVASVVFVWTSEVIAERELLLQSICLLGPLRLAVFESYIPRLFDGLSNHGCMDLIANDVFHSIIRHSTNST